MSTGASTDEKGKLTEGHQLIRTIPGYFLQRIIEQVSKAKKLYKSKSIKSSF